MRRLDLMTSLRIKTNLVYKKISGRVITFLVLYVDDILIENDVGILSSMKA